MAARVGPHRVNRCANFAANSRGVGHPRARSLRPNGLVWHSGCGKPADRMAIPTCCLVSLLSERGCAGLGSQTHLPGHDAIHGDSTYRPDLAIYLPATGALAAQSNVWWVNYGRAYAILTVAAL